MWKREPPSMHYIGYIRLKGRRGVEASLRGPYGLVTADISNLANRSRLLSASCNKNRSASVIPGAHIHEPSRLTREFASHVRSADSPEPLPRNGRYLPIRGTHAVSRERYRDHHRDEKESSRERERESSESVGFRRCTRVLVQLHRDRLVLSDRRARYLAVTISLADGVCT